MMAHVAPSSVVRESKVAVFIVVVFAIVLFASPSKADTIYTYTGNPFTDFFNTACPPTCNMSGFFTLSSPLAPNTVVFNLIPDSFSFTDGSVTITDTNATVSPFGSGQFSDFWVTTNSLGNIVVWNTQFFSGPNFMFSGTNPPGCVGCGVIDTSGAFVNTVVGSAFVNDNPGTWSVTPVPEPGSVLFITTGLLGVGVLEWRKRRIKG